MRRVFRNVPVLARRIAVAGFGVAVVAMLPVQAAVPAQAHPFRALAPAQAGTLTGELRLDSQTHVVGPLDRLNLAARFVLSDDIPDTTGLEIATAIHQRVTSRSELLESINAGRHGSTVTVLTQPLAAPNEGIVAIQVSGELGTCVGCIPLSTDGVYPVTLDIRRISDGRVIARATTYTILARTAPPTSLDVALLVPVTLQTTLQPDGTRRPVPLTDLIAASESLVSHRQVPLSVVLTPSVVDHAASDTAVDGALATLSQGIEGRELIASPYEVIRAPLVADGRLAEVVKGLWTQGADTLEQRWPDLVQAGVWIGLSDASFPGRDSLAVLVPDVMVLASSLVGSTNVIAPDAPFIETSPPLPRKPVLYDTGIVLRESAQGLQSEETLEESTGIKTGLADSTLTDHLRDPNATIAVARLLADLTIAVPDANPDDAVIVAVPDEAVTRRSVLDLLLEILPQTPALQGITVSEALDRPVATSDTGELLGVARLVAAVDTIADGSDQVIADESPTEELQPLTDRLLEQIDTARRAIDGVSSTMPNNPSVPMANRLFAAALADPQTGRPGGLADSPIVSQDHLAAAQRTANDSLRGIRLSPGRPVRLTALKGRIPLTIENNSGSPVKVHLSVAKGRVLVSTETAEQDLLVNEASLVVPIDIETRSSGSFDIRVDLTTPNGVPLSQQNYTVRSFGVSGIGLGLTISLLVLLGAWWLRSRFSRRTVPGAS
jgi:hypothetical protein